MHELSITRSVVELCTKRALGQQVIRVTLEIGKLSAVMPDAVRFCFEICAEGTPIEGAELEIIETQGQAQCRDCGSEIVLTELYGRCGCGGTDLKVIAGDELKIKHMEVAECA